MSIIHSMDISRLRRVDLNLLKSLHVLLEDCNVTHAARRLHLSQPALSAQLRQMRVLFEDPLLVPAARGMTRTVLGGELVDPLRSLLQDLQQLVSHRGTFDPATADTVIHVMSSDLIHHVISLPLIRHLREVAPGVRVALLLIETGAPSRQLADGDVDLIMTLPRGMPEQVRSTVLYDETFTTVMRKHHPVSLGRLGVKRFCEYDHVMISPDGGGFHGFVDDALAVQGVRRNVIASLPSFLMVPTLLASSDLLCTVPTRIAETWRGVLSLRRPPCVVDGFSVAMGWHPRSDADPAQRWLRQQIVELANTL